MEPETKVVHVAKDGQPALAAPNFVIEDGERLYVAIAVLEYDPGAQDLTDEQKRGIEEMRQMFVKSQDGGSLRAGRIDYQWTALGPMHTGPKPAI